MPKQIVYRKLKELKNQFGDESSQITITMQNVNNTIEEDGLFDLNENYKRVSLTIGSFTGEINVYFNNFQNISNYLTKIIEKDANFFDEIVDIDYSDNKETNLIVAKKSANFYKNKFGWEVKVGFIHKLKNFVISVDDYHFKLTKFLDDTLIMPLNKSIYWRSRSYQGFWLIKKYKFKTRLVKKSCFYLGDK
ncbi:hypothetical protein [Spiroplasma endosymbiont of Clivina fossor]|uniref:hypothetical protein n=1 Tax=Spiroplasma endosymbiont of Clivina fossor TaxID=3066282 RepID=UPI00313CEA87